MVRPEPVRRPWRQGRVDEARGRGGGRGADTFAAVTHRGTGNRIRADRDRHALLLLAALIARRAAGEQPLEQLTRARYDHARLGPLATAPSAKATCSRLKLSWAELLSEIAEQHPAATEHRIALRGRAAPRPLPTVAEIISHMRRAAAHIGRDSFDPREYDDAADELRTPTRPFENADRIQRGIRAAGHHWDWALKAAGLNARPRDRNWNAPGLPWVAATDHFITQTSVYPSREQLRHWGTLTGVRIASHARTGLTADEIWQAVADVRALRGAPTPKRSRNARIDWDAVRPPGPQDPGGRVTYADPAPPREEFTTYWDLQAVIAGLEIAHALAAARGMPLTQRTLSRLAAKYPWVPHPSRVDRIGRAAGIDKPLHTLRRIAVQPAETEPAPG